jgi:hypothetical protein
LAPPLRVVVAVVVVEVAAVRPVPPPQELEVAAVRPVPLPQEPEVAALLLVQGLVASESLRSR